MSTDAGPGTRAARWFAEPGLSSLLIAALAVTVLAGTLLEAAGFVWAHALFGWPSGLLLSLIALQSLWAVFLRFFGKQPGYRMSVALIVSHTGLSLLIIGALLSALTSREYVLGIAENAESSEAFYRDGWDLRIDVDGTARSMPLESLAAGAEIRAESWTLRLISQANDSGGLPELGIEAKSQSMLPQMLILKAGVLGGENGAKTFTDLKNSSLSVGLEPRKTSLPFVIRLDDFTIKNYPNTNEAADYTSSVHVSVNGSSQPAVISMNRPLRVAGYVLYQSSWEDLGGGKQASVLLVQFRPMSELPYIGAIVLGLGFVLYPFARKRKRNVAPAGAPAKSRKIGVLAAVLVVSCLLGLLPALLKSAGGFVQVAGRVQPLDFWLDRVMSHLDFENAVDIAGEESGTGTNAGRPEFRTLFRENPRALASGPFLSIPAEMFGLEGGKGLFIRSSLDSVTQSWDALSGRLNDASKENVTLMSDLSSIGDAFYKSGYFTISAELRILLGLPEGSLSFVQIGRALRKLFVDSGDPDGRPRLPDEIARNPRDKVLLLVELPGLIARCQEFAKRYAEHPLRIVPSGTNWLRPIDLVWDAERFGNPDLNTRVSAAEEPGHFTVMARAVIAATRELDTMPAATWSEFWPYMDATYSSWQDQPESFPAKIENVYRMIPWFALVLAGSVLCLAAVFVRGVAYRLFPAPASAGRLARISDGATRFFALAVALFSWCHVFMRIFVSSLPPISSLESSLLFVSSLTFLFALWFCFSGTQRNLCAGLTVLGLAVAVVQVLALGTNDEFAPVIAVLNTPFWLAVHVTTVALGYALVLVSALLGHIRLFSLLRGGLAAESIPASKMDGVLRGFLIAGLACTAMGTVLGGFWADQSWGRFWGWDPKENGALIIVLWTAFVLHYWAGGRSTPVRVAALSAWGTAPLVFSWFGINFLGKGLHSYGFSDGPVTAIAIVILAETTIVGFAFFKELVFARARETVLKESGAFLAHVERYDIGGHPAVAQGATAGPAVQLSGQKDSVKRLWLNLPADSPRLTGGDAIRLSYRRGARWISRAYSVSGTAEALFRVTVKPSGPRSSSAILTSLRPGTPVYVQGPFGDLRGISEKLSGRAKIKFLHCISFGIGAAPIVGLLESLASKSGDIGLRVWHSGSGSVRDELEQIVSRFSGARFSVSDAANPVSVSSIIAEFGTGALWLVCGAPESVAALDRERREAGIPDATWFAEAFSESAFDPPPNLETRSVLLHPSRVVVQIPAGHTLLSALSTDPKAKAVIPDAAFRGCGIGRCGTCSARLLSGSVVHARGVDHGSRIKLCASWPQTDCEIEFN